MYLINNRYRIIRNINHNTFVSTFSVIDILKNNKIVALNLINTQSISLELKAKLFSEFSYIKNIDTDNILKLYNYETVLSIDNKRNKDISKYYYTSEYFESQGNLGTFINKLDEKDKLNIFITLCRSVSYLHRAGIFYETLVPENVLLADEGKQIKLNDVVTMKLEQNYYRNTIPKFLYFKAPEVINESTYSASADIYSLGAMLLCLGLGKMPEEGDIEQLLKEFKEDEGLIGAKIYKLLPVIACMLATSVDERYNSINEVVTDINSILGTEYLWFNKIDLEKLHMNNKIVGREFEINSVLEMYNNMALEHNYCKIVLIHGEEGVGKTRFLNSLKHRLTFKVSDVYYNIAGQNSNYVNRPLSEILKQFITECDKELILKYENELVKFVPEIASNKKQENINELSGEIEKYRLMNRIVNFFVECLKGRSAIFLVDDAHLVDEFTIEFLKYLVDRKSENIMFILSYTDHSNDNLNDVIDVCRNNNLIMDITLRGLNFDETHELLKNMLFFPQLKQTLSTRVYAKTFGNPSFTEKIMKNLLDEKVMYIDKEGRWATDYSIKNIPLPSSVEQILNSQIKNLSIDQETIIKIISLFKSPVPSEVILQLSNLDKKSYEEVIYSLVNKGIVSQNIEDFGYAYDFTNNTLKNIVYEALDNRKKKLLHRKAAESLESFFDNNSFNSEELIYQFEKCNDIDRVIKYCLNNANLMNKFRNSIEEIKNIKKAVSVIKKHEMDRFGLDLVVRLVRLYLNMGSLIEANRYLKMLEKYARIINESALLAYCYNRLGFIAYMNNDVASLKVNAGKVIDIFSSVEFPVKGELLEEFIESEIIKSRIFMIENKYVEARKLLLKTLSLCGNFNIEKKGFVMRALGDVSIGLEDEKNALKYYKKGLKSFYKCKNYVGAVFCINSIGLIYSNYNQDYKEAIGYFNSGKEICENENIIMPKVFIYTSLGDAYSHLLEYKKAYTYFLEALDLSKKAKREEFVYLCYSNLAITAIKLGNFEEGYKYKEILINTSKNYGKIDNFTRSKYYDLATIFYEFGDLEIAENFIEIAMKQSKGYINRTYLDLKMLRQYILAYKMRTGLDEFDFNISKEIIGEYSFKYDKIQALFSLLIPMLEQGIRPKEYIEEMEKISMVNIPKILEIKRLYIKGLCEENQTRINFFKSALILCDEEESDGMKWKILYNIGEYYYEKDKIHTANYYYASSKIIKNIVMKLPDEFKILYFNKNNGIAPFKGISKLANKDIDTNIVTPKQLNRLFNYGDFQDIFENTNIMEIAMVKSSLSTSDQLDDLLLNIGTEDTENFKFLGEYFGKMTLACKNFIVLDDPEKGLVAFTNNLDAELNGEIRLVIDRVRAEKKPVLVTTIEMLKTGEDAKICIPVIKSGSLLGYIYLDSDKIINNFNQESFDKCTKLISLVSVLMEKYMLKQNNSLDRLTGTYTKITMEEIIDSHIMNITGGKEIFSLIMFDLDLFKNINDRFGHHTGDIVLKKVCNIVLEMLDSKSFCGRFGGEEFVILVQNMDKNESLQFAEAIRTKVDLAKILGEKASVTLSLGVSSYPEHGELQSELIEKADQALYVAKELGRNRSQIWNEKFSDKFKVTDKLTGILSGNIIQNHRNVSAMVEIINLIKLEISLEDKIFKFLGRIVEITEAQSGALLLVEDNNVTEKYCRKNFNDEGYKNVRYNENIVQEVINTQRGSYGVDWEDNINIDSFTGLPDWSSIIVIPMIKNGVTKGVLYLNTPLRSKEFNFNNYNFVESIGQIIIAII